MLSNNRIALSLTLLLAGCGGGGYGDAPRLGDPTLAMVDATLQPRPQPEYRPEPIDAPEPDEAPGAPYEEPGQSRLRYEARPVAPLSVPPSAPPSAAMPAEFPSDLPVGSGPRGTSDGQRYDAVGYASWYGEEMGGGRTASGQPFNPAAVTAAHNRLPLGSFVEITALDTGRTIVALVNDRGPNVGGREIDLSRGAAQQLGIDRAGVAPVRVRLTSPPPPDQMALRRGQAAASRMDAPASLLTALRRKLPSQAGAARAAPMRPAPIRSAPGAAYAQPGVSRPQPVVAGAGLYVQIAALSNAGRAQSLADDFGGRVARAGSIYRVQIGPFASNTLAQRARDDVARRGYGDARIVQTN